MKTNPVLAELGRVKDGLGREAGYDIDRIFAELRVAEARQPGPLVRPADDLRRYVADQEARLEDASPPALGEQPPPTPFARDG